MNYKKIYKDLIKTRKKMQDERKENRKEYENHHIIPTFMFKYNERLKRKTLGVGKIKKGHLEGDPNSKLNLVLLTPREHFISHILLYKIFYGKKYGYQCGSSLFMFFKHNLKTREEILNSRHYEYYKREGIKCLSELQTGMMPARDQETGELVGQVPTNHPNVLSGKWAHHHKGRKRSKEFCEKRKKGSIGSGNSNYKRISKEEIWEHLIIYIRQLNMNDNRINISIWSKNCALYFKEKYEFKKIHKSIIFNKLELKPKEVVEKYNKQFNTSLKNKKGRTLNVKNKENKIK